MIRRDDPPDWLLIRQIDHARVAGEIAAVWEIGEADLRPLGDQLFLAVRRHDDGWQTWEAAPEIDPDTGVPRSFTEMPMAVSTAIWTASILACAQDSPWGGLWVSRHFCWLAEQAQQNRRDDPGELAPIAAFLGEQADRQQAWKAEAARTVGPTDCDRLIETGFRYVQLFDRLSLWLCCARRSQSSEMQLPDGRPLQLIPQSDETIVLRPFPLTVERLQLTTVAQRLPAQPLASNAEFQEQLAAANTQMLQWVLTH